MEKSPDTILENPQKKTSNAEKEEQPTPILAMKFPSTKIEKAPLPFNLGVEVAKLKISVPLTELIKSETYKSQINKTLNFVENEDSVNLFDD